MPSCLAYNEHLIEIVNLITLSIAEGKDMFVVPINIVALAYS
jgi:hypothetical protein